MRNFALGLILGLSLVGCAGFSYRYYGMDLPSYEGTLLGPTKEQDEPFRKCAPGAQIKNPCVVLFKDEFYAFKQDYLQCKQDLKACQSPK